MKLLFECKDMDSAGALHNAFLDYMVEPEGTETKVSLVLDHSGHEGVDWHTGWFVKMEQVIKKKAPTEAEALTRGD